MKIIKGYFSEFDNFFFMIHLASRIFSKIIPMNREKQDS